MLIGVPRPAIFIPPLLASKIAVSSANSYWSSWSLGLLSTSLRLMPFRPSKVTIIIINLRPNHQEGMDSH
jgi:hypothetical protein